MPKLKIQVKYNTMGSGVQNNYRLLPCLNIINPVIHFSNLLEHDQLNLNSNYFFIYILLLCCLLWYLHFTLNDHLNLSTWKWKPPVSLINLFLIKNWFIIIYSKLFLYIVPSIGGGLHDEVHVVSALPPAAGVGEVHLLSVLSHRQVVYERQLPASDHLTTRHQPGRITCTEKQQQTTETLKFGLWRTCPRAEQTVQRHR